MDIFGQISPALYALPFISGSIGWFTNYLAVKMLTRPVKPINILGIKIQGVIPRRHEDLADKVAEAVKKDFFKSSDLEESMAGVDFKPIIKEIFLRKWDEKIGDVLDSLPMIKMFLPPDKLDDIKIKIVEAFTEGNGNSIGKTVAESITKHVDISAIVKKNILAFDLDQLESIIHEIAKKELRFIEHLGGFLGFIIGLVQLLLVLAFR